MYESCIRVNVYGVVCIQYVYMNVYARECVCVCEKSQVVPNKAQASTAHDVADINFVNKVPS